MIFQLYKELNYLPDEGWHNAVLKAVRCDGDINLKSCDCRDKVRFTFHLETDPKELDQYVAATNFCATEAHSQELTEFLKKMLGTSFGKYTLSFQKITLEAGVRLRIAAREWRAR